MLATSVYADTCKYEDADGRIVYTNIPLKGAKKLTCFGFDGSPKEKAAPRISQPSPANFPKVDPNTQKQRDDTRRKILEQELEAEEKALEEAKKAYAEGEANPEVFQTVVDESGKPVLGAREGQPILDASGKPVLGSDNKPLTYKKRRGRNMAAYDEKMKQLQANVDLHQKNIEMLQKELAGLR